MKILFTILENHRESQVDPKYIELEITESLFSENPEDVIDKLFKLKELGVRDCYR